MTGTLRLKTALMGMALFSCLAGFCRSADGKEDGDGAETVAAGDDRTRQKVVDLLGRVTLARKEGNDGSVVSGAWAMLLEGLKCEGPVSEVAPGRIKLGAAYSGDYDLCMTFTPIQGRGGIGIVLAHKGREFAWMMGTGDGSTFGFQRSSLAESTASGIPPLVNGQRCRVEIRVRGDRACAKINDQPEFEYLTDYSDLGLSKGSSLGDGQLGIVSAREILVHSAEMKCLAPAPRNRANLSKSDRVAESKGQTTGGEVLPKKSRYRGQQIKTFTPDRVKTMNCTLVVVERNAKRVVIRQDGERRYRAEWIFAVNGNKLDLISFRPISGTPRAMDGIRAGGFVNGNTMRINWSWRFTGPRRANQPESGYIQAELEE